MSASLMEKLYYKLMSLLKEQELPDDLNLIPKEELNQMIITTHREIYPHLAARIASLRETDDFEDYAPLLLDYIDTPIYCDDVDEIHKQLELEEKFPDLEFENDQSISNDFVTAGGAKIEKDVCNGSKTSGMDKESGIEEKIIERIKFEILEGSPNVQWTDIAGLENVKRIVNEIVVWPMQRPDIFTGLRAPPKGLLLFGPPGTGKTMIGKCIASQCEATFFSISASSLTSKWVGEGEKMVRALFFMARKMQPSVIFIDEIDSLLSQRQDNENDGMRRIKTEFLVQFDGAGTACEEKILIIGATNRPHEIDEAARRRLVKRIYVPLPDTCARTSIITNLLKNMSHNLSEPHFAKISEMTDGYSGSDMFSLCREASMEPIREILDIRNADSINTRPICLQDFSKAVNQIKKSVCQEDLNGYETWNEKFGSS